MAFAQLASAILIVGLAAAYFHFAYPRLRVQRIKRDRIILGCVHAAGIFLVFLIAMALLNLNVVSGERLRVGPWPWFLIVQFAWIYNVLVIMRSLGDSH